MGRPRGWARAPVVLSLLLLAGLAGAFAYRAGRAALRDLDSVVAPQLAQMLGREVRVGRASVSGMNRIVIEDLAIADGASFQSGTLLKARRAVLRFSLAGLLRHRDAPTLAVASLRLENPDLLLVRQRSGDWNVASLLGSGSGGPGWQQFRGRLVLDDARVTLRDYRAGDLPAPAVTRLQHLSLTLDARHSPAVTLALAARGDGRVLGKVDLSGSYHLERRALSLQASFDGANVRHWQRYSQAAPVLPVRAGTAAGSFDIAWTIGKRPEIQGTVRVPHLVLVPSAVQEPVVAQPLVVRVHNERLTLEAEGHSAGVPLSLEGGLVLRANDTLLDLRLRAPRVTDAGGRKLLADWPQIRGVTWQSAASLEAHVTGSSNDWQAVVTGRLPRLHARGVDASDLNVRFTYQRNQRLFVVHSAEAQAAGGKVVATGRVDVKPTPARVYFRGTATDVDVARLPFLSDESKSGRATVSFVAQGPTDGVQTEAQIAGKEIALGPAHFGSLAAEITLPWEGPLQVRARAASVATAPARPTRLAARGGARHETAQATGEAALPTAESASARFEVLPGGVRIHDGRVVVAGQALSVSGTVSPAGALDLQVGATRADAAALARLFGMTGISGKADVQARIGGTLAQPRVSGTLKAADGRVRDISFGGLRAKYTLQSLRSGTVEFAVENARAQGLAIRSASGQALLREGAVVLPRVQVQIPQGSFTASGKVTHAGGLDLALRTPEVDLGGFAGMAGMGATPKELPAAGKAAFEGRLLGTLSAPQVRGRITAAKGSLSGLDYDELRAGVRADAGGLALNNVVVRRGSESLSLAGSASVDRQGPMVVSGRLSADSLDVAAVLQALGVPLPLAGRGKADLEISGAFPNLTVAGDFTVANAVFAGVAVGRVSGRLQRAAEGKPGGIRVERLTIEDGPARLVAAGELAIGGRVDLEISGQQVPLALLNRLTQPYAELAGRVDVSGTVSGTTADPRLQLSVRGGSVSVNGHGLGTLAGQVAYAGGEAKVTHLSVARGPSRYQVDRLSLQPSKGMLDLEASATQADLAYLASLARSLKLPDTPFGRDLHRQIAALPNPVAGTVTGKVTLHGPVARASGIMEFNGRNLALGPARLHQFAGKAIWAPGAVELSNAVLAADGVDLAGGVRLSGRRLTTQVRLGPSRVESLHALATTLSAVVGSGADPEAASPFAAALASLPEPFTGTVSGEVALSGNVAALNGSARLMLTDARVGETRLAQTGATLQWDAGNVSADNLSLRAEGIDIGGSFARQADGRLSLELQIHETEVAAVRDLTRAVASLGQATGVTLLPATTGDLLQQLPEGLDGRVTGTLVLSGRPGALTGRVDVAGRDVRLGNATYALVEAQGSWSPQGWQFPRLALAGSGCTLSGSVTARTDGRLSARLATENAQLGALRDLLASLTPLRRLPAGEALLARLEQLPTPLDGRVTGSVLLGGSADAPNVRVQMTGSDLVAGELKLPRLTADAEVQESLVSIRNLRAAVNGGNLTAQGSLDLNGPLDLTVEGTELALAAFAPLLGLKQQTAGKVSLVARVTGTLDRPVANVRVAMREARIGGVHLSRVDAEGVQVAEGRLNLGRVTVAGDQVNGFLSGHVPFRWRPLGVPRDEPIQLMVSLPRYDLATLAALAGEGAGDKALALAPKQSSATPVMEAVRSATGQVEAELAVTGTLDNPNMNGRVVLHEAAIHPAMLEHGFSDINGLIRLEGPWVIVENLRGRSDRGGWLTLSGRAAIRGQGGGAMDLRLRAEQVQLALQKIAGIEGLAYKGTADGDLALTGQPGNSRLSGNVVLSQSQVSAPSDLSARLPAAPKLPLDPTLDVSVRVARGSWVKRGRSLSAMVTGDADLRGMLSRPMVGGRAVVERGDLSYAGVNFRLVPGGTVSFAYESPGPMATRLDVTAETRLRAVSPSTGGRRNYTVTMHVVGTMPHVNVAVSSDPPDLPQHRLLAVLARTDQFEALARGENLDGVLRDQVANLLVDSMLPQVFEPIEEGIAQALGLDQVSFDYGFDQPLRVDARKEVLPRLFISYNRDMGEGHFLESREQWTVSYRLFQRLYLGWRHEAQTGRSDRIILEGSFRF